MSSTPRRNGHYRSSFVGPGDCGTDLMSPHPLSEMSDEDWVQWLSITNTSMRLHDALAETQRLQQAVIDAARDSHRIGVVLPALSTTLDALDQHISDTKAP